MPRILKTEGGAHPPEKWATLTAEEIVPIEGMGEDRRLDALRLQVRVADVILLHHAAAATHERECLDADGDGHFDCDHHGPTDEETLMSEILAVTDQSPFAAHFRDPSVYDAILGVLRHHTVGLRHVERLVHAENNPDLAAGRDYRVRHGQRAV